MSPIENVRLKLAVAYDRFRRSPVRSLFNLTLRLAGAFLVTEIGRRTGVSDLIIFPMTLLVIVVISILCHVTWRCCDEKPFLSRPKD
jgi:hypothetical protein